MTGARLQIRTEEHARLSVSRPPSWLNSAAGPSMPEDAAFIRELEPHGNLDPQHSWCDVPHRGNSRYAWLPTVIP
jgi:hypothetical protein